MALAAVVAASLTGHAGAADNPVDQYANAPAYLKAATPRTKVSPLVTVGQEVPLAGGQHGEKFRCVGIPDGMGLMSDGDDLVLLVNHEFDYNVGGPAGPLPTGARISEFRLERRQSNRNPLRVESGRYTIERVYDVNGQLVVPGPTGIGRFCSAFLGGANVGFDRPIYLNGEEAESPETFDGRGGLAWATFEGGAWALPRVGRASWENVVAVPFTGAKTVLFALEDGPSSGNGLNSQLYMYVGDKDPNAPGVLGKNGLDNGRVYAFVSDDATRNSEQTFNVKGGFVTGHWVEIDWTLDDIAFDQATRAAGAFSFIRIEDGASDVRNPGTFYFVTTGKRNEPINPYGRTYKLNFNPLSPLGPAVLTLVLDGSEGIVSPDNVDLNRHGELAIQEDPVYNLSDLGLARDSSVWVYDVDSGELTRIAEIDRDRARAHALRADQGNSSVPSSDVPGGWESSGIIDAEEYLGRGSWLLNIEAHSLRIVPVEETVQGGQICYVQWTPQPGVGAPDGPDLSTRDAGATPAGYALTAEPNPFNPATAIRFRLPAAMAVSLRIYDASGRLVRALVDGTLAAGQHEVAWNGRDDRGAGVSSGVYFYSFAAGELRAVEKLVLMK
jgi:hypothetical protein